MTYITKRILGIDLGCSPTNPTSAYSQWEVRIYNNGSKPSYSLHIVAPTQVITLQDLKKSLPVLLPSIDLVAVDAPLTPAQVQIGHGRNLERAFSSGQFAHNPYRGLQPGSIATPKQGWALYCAGMAIVMNDLKANGFPYFPMPVQTSTNQISINTLGKPTIEVIPKLTQGLLVPQQLVANRPRTGFFKQIDNWLFPQLFCSPGVPIRSITAIPPIAGAANNYVKALGVPMDISVFTEADDIQTTGTQKTRHERIGAFVAGFQGALAFTKKTSLIGVFSKDQGYYSLPSTDYWHPDWQAVWTATAIQRARLNPPVYEVKIC